MKKSLPCDLKIKKGGEGDSLFRERESLYLRLGYPVSRPKDSSFNLSQKNSTGFLSVSIQKLDETVRNSIKSLRIGIDMLLTLCVVC